MRRYKHTLSHYRMHTGKMGQLMPICCVPVLPGDTFQHHTTALIRVTPLNTPVMHPVNVRIHHFFVPNRIVWEGWENFITGGPDGNDAQVPPLIDGGHTFSDRLTTYLGVPPEGVSNNVVSLPVRAANMIFNEYYRDQDLQGPRDLELNTMPNCMWEKDYFSTARPWTQKGSDVSIPIGEVSNVHVGSFNPGDFPATALGTDDNWRDVTDGGLNANEDSRLTANFDAITASINDFRTAFALQRYQEARARYGSRFTEYLRFLGITPSDARLDRPEYLGGSVARLSFSEVLQTTPGQADENGVGDLYGHGIAGVRTNRYRKFFEEHGYVISMLSVRPKATYINACHREFYKRTKEDYFQRELSNLGQQEVLNKEIHAGHNDLNGVFGYVDRYDEYRSHPSLVTNEFRDVLSSWHLARDLPDDVALNQSFVTCDPTDRIYQVSTNDPLWIMVNNHIVARRMVPKRANPRIL